VRLELSLPSSALVLPLPCRFLCSPGVSAGEVGALPPFVRAGGGWTLFLSVRTRHEGSAGVSLGFGGPGVSAGEVGALPPLPAGQPVLLALF
jgi:hypothetical protein